MLTKKFVLSCFLLVLFTFQVHAQLRINEVSSSNATTFPDNDGDNPDWIELYNPTAAPINLLNYKISDDALVPAKWSFPNVTIPAGGYLTVYASGKDRVDIIDHWEMIVRENDSWKYTIPNVGTPANWADRTFNDAAWTTGTGAIGYGAIGEVTTIPAGTVAAYMRRTFNVVDSAMIRDMVFHAGHDDGFVAYLNGVEIARNNVAGTPPAYNAVATTAYYSGLGVFDAYAVPPSAFKPLLRNGNNVLAIQLHNVNAASSDILMRAFLMVGIGNTATNYFATPGWFTPPASSVYLHTNFSVNNAGETITLYTPALAIVDQIAVPAIQTDDTYGRFPNGSATWSLLSPATPSATNGTSTTYLGYWTDPVGIALPAGFYTGTQTTILTKGNALSEIRYTIDGTKPTATSTLYTGGNISIPSTRVLRASCFRAGYKPSITNFQTNSYFINDPIPPPMNLPVVSISTAPANFFDFNTGIYEMGPGASAAFPHFGANFWQGWEREVHVEYFTNTGVQGFEQDMGVKIFGGWSRGQDMKSLRLKSGSEYGDGDVDYKLYPNKNIDKFDQFVLRNAGNDFNYAHMRDLVNHHVQYQKTFNDYQGFQPCRVYINGAYWGVHHMMERISEDFVRGNHGYDKDAIDLLEINGTVIAGDNTHFLNMINYVQNNAMTVAANYNTVKNTMLDIPNFVDYMACQTYHTNWDFPHNNIRFWHPKPSGKWRYFYYDTDFAFQLFNNCATFGNCPTSNELDRVINDTRSVHSPLLKKLLTNNEFRCYFVNRYADLINTIYVPANYKAKVDDFIAMQNPEMTRHFARWTANGGSMAQWTAQTTAIKAWMDARPANARNHLAAVCGGGTTQTTLTFNTSIAGAGLIQVSTIIPDNLPWSGVYFNCCPITITAIPNPGYTFSHWLSTSTIGTPNTNKSVTITPGPTETFTAYFTTTPNVPRVTISEINYNPNATCDAGDWIEFYNSGTAVADISGWQFKDGNDFNVFTFPANTTIPVGGRLVLYSDAAKFNTRHPAVANKIGPMTFNLSNGGEWLRLYDNANRLYLDMTYDDVTPWPLIADGGGSTLERVDPNNNNANLNDPASWFDGCKCGSPGTAFVPCPCTNVDLGPDRVLCASGGSVVLNTGLSAHPNRTFKWYFNGTELVGLNTPTFTATAAGTYSVLVDSMGCFKTDAIVIRSTLAFNLGPDLGLCAPASVTLNSGIGGSGITYVWRRNGTVLTGPGTNGPTLFVNSAATYQLTVSAAGCTNQVDDVVVSSTAATPTNGYRCGTGTVNLSVSGPGTYSWYTAATGGTLAASNTNSFTTPSLSTTTTYYVADVSYVGGTVGPASPSALPGAVWSNSDFNAPNNYKTRFNVLQAMYLRAVTVYTSAPGNVTIRILESNMTTVRFTRTVAVTTAGMNRIPLDFYFTGPATGLWIDAVGTNVSLQMNGTGAGATGTYTAAGYLNIHTETNPNWARNTNGWYFYFYNWEYSNRLGPCDRVPVVAVIDCVLPVDLVSFSGNLYNKEVMLRWSTSAEKNSAYFAVERSSDGVNFELIGTVQAAGNTQEYREYTLKDSNPLYGRSYYRLAQYDFDGKSHTSNMVVINNSEESMVNVFPNPYDGLLHVMVLNSGDAEDVSIVITDLSGKPVYESSGYKTNTQITLNDELSPGTYFLYVIWGGQKKVEKIIKR